MWIGEKQWGQALENHHLVFLTWRSKGQMGNLLNFNLYRESFQIETNGDHLMRSAHSSRLNPFHISNYRVDKMNESSMSNFARKSKLQKLGEIIQNQKSPNLSQISK